MQIERRGFALDARVRRQYHFTHRTVWTEALEQRGDVQLVRADAIQRRQAPAQHMIQAPVLARSLDGTDVRRLLHHAEDRRITARTAADFAERILGVIAAPRA